MTDQRCVFNTATDHDRWWVICGEPVGELGQHVLIPAPGGAVAVSLCDTHKVLVDRWCTTYPDRLAQVSDLLGARRLSWGHRRWLGVFRLGGKGFTS